MLIASTFILFAIVSEVFYYHSQAYHGAILSHTSLSTTFIFIHTGFSIDASRSHMVQFFKVSTGRPKSSSLC